MDVTAVSEILGLFAFSETVEIRGGSSATAFLFRESALIFRRPRPGDTGTLALRGRLF